RSTQPVLRNFKMVADRDVCSHVGYWHKYRNRIKFAWPAACYSACPDRFFVCFYSKYWPLDCRYPDRFSRLSARSANGFVCRSDLFWCSNDRILCHHTAYFSENSKYSAGNAFNVSGGVWNLGRHDRFVAGCTAAGCVAGYRKRIVCKRLPGTKTQKNA